MPLYSGARFSGFFFEVLLDVGAIGDLFAEVGGPVFAGVVLHVLVLFPFGGARADESADEGLVGRRLDADSESGGGAGGVLGFVAADGVSESVFGDGPGAVERVAVGGSGEQGRGVGDSLSREGRFALGSTPSLRQRGAVLRTNLIRGAKAPLFYLALLRKAGGRCVRTLASHPSRFHPTDEDLSVGTPVREGWGTLDRGWLSNSRSFDFACFARFAQDDIVVSCG